MRVCPTLRPETLALGLGAPPSRQDEAIPAFQGVNPPGGLTRHALAAAVLRTLPASEAP